MSARPSLFIFLVVAALSVLRAHCVLAQQAPAARDYSQDANLGLGQAAPYEGNPAANTDSLLDRNPGLNQQPHGQPGTGPDALLRSLMDRLGIQKAEQGREKHFVQRGAAARDRDRLPQSRRIRPPDAYHSGPTATHKVVDDATRRAFAAGGASAGRSRGFYYGYGRAGGVGSLGGIRGPYESGELLGVAPSTAMGQTAYYGAWTNSAMGTTNYGYGIGSRSPSRLLQGGSPSDLGSQPGSPSSIYTIGAGNTLSGSGAMPGPSGMGVSTGAGVFGINGPMGAAGS